MSILQVGDLHGEVDALANIIQSAEAKKCAAIIQVGDFGYGFPDKCWDDFFNKRARQGKWTVPIYTCAGNHDNWDMLDQLTKDQNYPNQVEMYPGAGLYFIPRGNVVEIAGIKHLFLGGAESTDKYRRTEGINWWAREQSNQEEFEKFFYNLEKEKPNTIIAHDAPLRVDIYRAGRKKSLTPVTIERMLELSNYQPKRYAFGHHHLLEKWKIGKTKYYCCGLHGQYWERNLVEVDED